MTSLEEDIAAIKMRNKEVDENKAWETSSTRRVSIASMTYFFAVAWLTINSSPMPFLGALFPAFGYLLSTAALPVIRKKWDAHYLRKKLAEKN